MEGKATLFSQSIFSIKAGCRPFRGKHRSKELPFDCWPLTATELENLQPLDYGNIIRIDGTAWNSSSLGTPVILTYTYGMDRVPEDLRVAAIKRLRTRVVDPSTGIPDRATSLMSPEGGTFQLATPGRGGFETGIPDVDAVYKRYSFRPPGVG